MSEPFLGEIRMVSFGFAPKGWALCNGQLLAINQNQAIFSLLGTTYGGNGTTNFALPDLRGRAPMHVGNGVGLTPRDLGEVGGESTHVLTIGEMPAHTHIVSGRAAGTAGSPSGALWAGSGKPAYTGSPTGPMSAGAISAAGGGQAHENKSPYLTVNFVMAIAGIFPSRN